MWFLDANFPPLKLKDFINVTRILSSANFSKLQENNKDDLLIVFAYIKVFIANYYDCLSIRCIELEMAVKRTSKVPQSLLKEKTDLSKYVNGEIVHQPLGVVFQGKINNGKTTMFFILSI